MSNLPPHSKMLTLRLTDADHAVVTARATRAGLTVSDYMRRAALGTLVAAPTVRTTNTAPVTIAELPETPHGKGNAALQKYLRSAPGDDPA